MKLYLDDKPINVTGAGCDENYKCSWEKFAAYLESRMFKDSISAEPKALRDFCFSHLNYDVKISEEDENISWWAAFVIALPLVAITMAIIKIAVIFRRKQQ